MVNHYGLEEIVLPEGYYIFVDNPYVDMSGFPSQYLLLRKKGRWFDRTVVSYKALANCPKLEADKFKDRVLAYLGRGGISSGRIG